MPDGTARNGQRLCIHHTPASGAVHAAVLYTHPFAEEMNKSRRMAALCARSLAASGCAVLQIDLLGCGDSSGDFGDATWDDWLADVERGARWLQTQHDAPMWFWGLRSGCLLNVEASARLRTPAKQLFWQPPPSGKVLLQQFLRIKLVSSLAEDKGNSDQEPRQQLAAGRAVEIAGYSLQPALAQGLERAKLQPPAAVAPSIWLETSSREGGALLPATQAAATQWRDAGHPVQAEVVQGPAFWQTQEIEDAPALVAATVRAVSQHSAPRAHPAVAA